MNETLITKPASVLDENGRPRPGYSTKEVLNYHRKDIRVNMMRIKEWDFYQIEDEAGEYCLQLTYGHAAYIGQIGVMFFNIKKQEWILNESLLIPFAIKRMPMPESASRDHAIHYQKKGFEVHFVCQNHIRDLTLITPHFKTELHLEPLIPHALIINIPFQEDPRFFYYNYKLNGMKASGFISWEDEDNRKHLFTLDDRVHYALLDWGRGVWPYHNEWFWSNGQGLVEGKLFGFNLGCGFGDTSQATENIFFYEGIPHKIGAVTITHGEDFMQPWQIDDEEDRCHLVVTPEFDRITRDRVLFVNNCTHQVFGRFYGTIVLDDGRKLIIKDLPAFVEHAVNNW